MVSHGQVLNSEKSKLNLNLELDRNVKLMLQKMNKSTKKNRVFSHADLRYVT